MSSAATLLLLIILFVLLAIAVIIVIALVQRPRAAWRAQWKRASNDVRRSRGRRLIGEPVQPALVRFDEVWATTSEPGSAYVAAPRIPTKEVVKEVVEERLSIGPYAVSEETIERVALGEGGFDVDTPPKGVSAMRASRVDNAPLPWAAPNAVREPNNETVEAAVESAADSVVPEATFADDGTVADWVSDSVARDVALEMPEGVEETQAPEAAFDGHAFEPTEFSPATTQVARWVEQGAKTTVSWVVGLDLGTKISALVRREGKAAQEASASADDTDVSFVVDADADDVVSDADTDVPVSLPQTHRWLGKLRSLFSEPRESLAESYDSDTASAANMPEEETEVDLEDSVAVESLDYDGAGSDLVGADVEDLGFVETASDAPSSAVSEGHPETTYDAPISDASVEEAPVEEDESVHDAPAYDAPIGVVPVEEVPSEDDPPHPVFFAGFEAAKADADDIDHANAEWLEALMAGGPVLPRDDYRANLPPLDRDQFDA